MNQILQTASEYLKTMETCVIATAGADGQPEAATIGFSHDDSFVILFGTNRSTRKYANLKANPKCALVVGFESPQTVQIEGIAEEVDAADIADRLQQHTNKVPAAKRFAEQEGQTWFFITPTWLRHTNYAAPEPVLETEEF